MVEPFLNHRVLIDTISPVVEQLVQRTSLAAKLSVRQGDDAITVYRVESPKPMSLSGRVGVRFSLIYGSSGACLLSALSDKRIARIIDEAPAEAWKHQTPGDVLKRIAFVRQDGTSADMGQFHPQVHTISAPLFDGEGTMLASLTLLGLPEDMNEAGLGEHRKLLLKAATRCNQLIKRDELTVELK
jgi:DNA-binding IclR family transcriptional regulator